MDLSKFYEDTLSGVAGAMPGALQQMQQSSKESIDMQRQALDAYRASMGQDDGVNLPLLRFSAAIGRPTTGGLGGALSSGMDAYAGALQQQRNDNLSKAEKLAIIQQGLAKLHQQGGALPWEGIDRSLSGATRVGEIDVLRATAQDRSAYDAFRAGAGPGPGAAAGGPAATAGGLPPLSPPEPAPNVAQAAGAAAATGQVAQAPQAAPAGDRLPPEAMQRYMRNRQIIERFSSSRDPRAVSEARRAQDENEALVPKGVFVKPDGSLDTTALRIQAQAKKADTPVSASDRKAIMEADEAVMTNEGVITSLDAASRVSKGAYGNPIGSVYSRVGQYFGDDAAKKTVELQNLTTAQALEQLKSTFGAAPTEGERKILLEIQGSASLPDEQRQKIFARAKAAAERRLEFNRQQAEQLRGGNYYKPGQGPNAPRTAPQAGGGGPVPNVPGARLAPDGNYYVETSPGKFSKVEQ